MRLVGDLVVAALAAGGFYVASATNLGATVSSTLAADSAAVSSCDTDGVVSGFVLDEHDGSIVAVDVAGTDTACAGWTLHVTLQDGGGAPLSAGAAPVPAGGTPVSVPVPATAASQVGSIGIVLSSV
jgi:hypothetical protein